MRVPKRLAIKIVAVLVAAAGIAGSSLAANTIRAGSVSGTKNDTVTGTGNRTQKQSVDGQGNNATQGGDDAIMNSGDGVQQLDRGNGPRNDSGQQYNGPVSQRRSTDDHRRSSSSSSLENGEMRDGDQRINNGQGTQNNQDTVNHNYPEPPADPPSPGVAAINSVKPADGGTTMGTSAQITFTVSKLPTNGNRLFMVCRLRLGSGMPDLYFAKATISDSGRQFVILTFGGAAQNNPALIGTQRWCFIVTAAPSGAEQLARLMYFDAKGIAKDPDGVPYDAQRTSLPTGVTPISTAVRIEIERLGP